jgi:hypothetical protein
MSLGVGHPRHHGIPFPQQVRQGVDDPIQKGVDVLAGVAAELGLEDLPFDVLR